MALFSLLMAVLADRLKLLPPGWQFDVLMTRLQAFLVRGPQPVADGVTESAAFDMPATGADVPAAGADATLGEADTAADAAISAAGVAGLTPQTAALLLLLPPLGVALLLYLAKGLLFGFVTLLIWLAVASLALNHARERRAFKFYVQAARRADVQSCYHQAARLDAGVNMDAVSAEDLGLKVGQSVAWINYRYYAAVGLYLLVLGPVGAAFYSACRFLEQAARQGHFKSHAKDNIQDSAQNSSEPLENQEQGESLTVPSLSLPYIGTLMWVLDWVPCRLVAFGYLLTGEFRTGFGRWRDLALNAQAPARKIITVTATEAESIPKASSAPVCLQPTLVLLALSKRNFVLLLTLASLLTIFGVL